MSLDDPRSIDQLLDESGVGASDALRSALMNLRAEGTGAVPETSEQLDRLMNSNVTELRPRRRAMRAAGLGIAVAAAAGLGVSGVAAASPQFRSAADSTFQQIVRFFDATPAETQPAPPVPEPAEPEQAVLEQGVPEQPVPGEESFNDAGTDADDAPAQPAGPESDPEHGNRHAPALPAPADKSAESPGRAPDHRLAEPGDRIDEKSRNRTILDLPHRFGRGYLDVPPSPAVPGDPAAPANPRVPVGPSGERGSKQGDPRNDGPLPGPPLHLESPALPGHEVLPPEWTDVPRPTQPGVKK